MTDECLFASCPADYKFVSRSRSRQRGGVAIIYRSEIKIHKLFLQRLPELECVSINIRYCRPRFIVMWVYKSTRYNNVRSVKRIGSLLKGLHSLKLPVILTGDINLHVDDVSDCKTAWLNFYTTSYNMMQHICCSTQVHGHCLDVVMTTPRSVDIISISVEPPCYSDHSLLLWECTVKQIRQRRQVCRWSLSVSLSFCLSHASIVSKWLNLYKRQKLKVYNDV